MQLSEEISCVRLGFRRGHALSAAQVPAGSQQMTRRSIENPRRYQYRGMIPLMQVALFLRQAQTLRNLLRERQECRKIVLDGWYLQGHTSPGHCVSNHLLAMSTTLNLVTEMGASPALSARNMQTRRKCRFLPWPRKSPKISASKTMKSPSSPFPLAGGTCIFSSPKP